MKPSPARVVLAVGGKAEYNGTDTCPAVITRVWGENDNGSWTVNARLLPDASNETPAVTSVYLHENEEAARATLTHPTTVALYWPARV